jgi:MFS family permease
MSCAPCRVCFVGNTCRAGDEVAGQKMTPQQTLGSEPFVNMRVSPRFPVDRLICMSGFLPNGSTRRATLPLLALNFFMADMQAGIGPFLGVFLLADGWRNGLIGTVMSIGGIAGMAVTAQGIGASLSPAIGGWMSQELGYSATFIVLGGFALASVALWIEFRALVSAAAAVPVDEAEESPGFVRAPREARRVAG